MSSKLLDWLGLSPQDRQSLESTTDRVKTLAEYLADVVDAVKDTDFVEAVAKAAPWWISAVGHGLAEAAPPIKFVATFFSKITQIRDPDQLAFLACTTAYQRATEQAFRRVGAPKSRPAAPKWNYADEMSAEGLSFATFSLDDPWSHAFLRESEKALLSASGAAGYDEAERQHLLREVQMRFVGHLRALLTAPTTRERFAPFYEALHFGSREERVRLAWSDHFTYQRYLFEEKPVFGEEPFALADVYVRTECGTLSWKEACEDTSGQQRRVDPFAEDVGGRHDLLDAVIRQMADDKFNDAIVVQGVAGSGKSAFSLALAVELQRLGLNPIRIRFRDISLQYTNVVDALPDAVRFWDPGQRPGETPPARAEDLFLGQSLFGQAAKLRSTSISRWVLILDGWDEVSIAANKGFAVRIAEILDQIRDAFLNRPDRPLVRVILTGRPTDAVIGTRFFTKNTLLLTIKSLRPEALGPYVRGLAQRLGGDAPPERAAPERFAPVIASYQQGFSGETDSFGRASGTMEVLGLPLLAHLAIRLMVRWPDDDLAALVENPTTLYRLLTDLTCEKGGRYGGDVYEPDLTTEDLRRLLHDTASAATAFGADSIPYEELDLRLSMLDEELMQRVERVTGIHPAAGLMINFFFKGGRSELGAEFVHKSFREYLYAEAIVEALKGFGRTCESLPPERPAERYWEDFRPDDPRYDWSRTLGRLLAPQWTSPEVARHLCALIEWEIERARRPADTPVIGIRTESLSMAQWELVRDGLADLWDWWGEGTHLRAQPGFRGKKLEEWQRPYCDELCRWAMRQVPQRGTTDAPPRPTSIDGHLGDALFRLNVLVHHHVAVPSGEDWAWDPVRHLTSVRRYQSVGLRNGVSKVRFRPTGLNGNYFSYYISRINAAGWYPVTLFPCGQTMLSTDLSLTVLMNTVFAGVDMRGCSLVESFTYLVGFANTDVHGADFTNVRLVGGGFPCRGLDSAMGLPTYNPRDFAPIAGLRAHR